ncbi:hypothetical protein Dip518_000596 [Parelusimicrobium proximum]|uniref:hypothetical protein n=1 Tax=Parelusimicrobium proximum TaxID=3228953 RepID=UPI003D176CD8
MKVQIKNVFSFLFAFIFLFCSVYTFAQQQDMSRQLNDGIKLFDRGRYDDATDKFIDVMMHGTSDQYKIADEYIDKIHRKIGNIEDPKFVPFTDEEKEAAEANRKAAQDKVAAERAAAEQAAKDAEEKARDLAAQASSATANFIVVVEDPAPAAQPKTPEYYMGIDPNGSSAKKVRIQVINQRIDEARNSLIAELQNTKGVKLHMRNGLPDALDIESSLIFDKNNGFLPSSAKILDKVYALMLLTAEATYVILPPGSYTDEVSLKGVRQALALSTALVYRGVSPGKVSYNMGLYDEEPPAKFANLDGLSIVFDYTAKPTLYLPDASTKSPLMSLGIFPTNHKILMNDKEGFLVDFSVIETASAVQSWQVQIIQHAKDGKFYIVRQVEGTGAIYSQIYSNGRKQFFGDKLTPGKYTIMLTAVDSEGRLKRLRRSVTYEGLPEDKKASASKPSAAAAKKGAKTDEDYKAARLWTRPKRTNMAEGYFPQEPDYSYTSPAQTSGGADPYAPVTTPPQTQSPAPAATAPDNSFPSEEPGFDPGGFGDDEWDI